MMFLAGLCCGLAIGLAMGLAALIFCLRQMHEDGPRPALIPIDSDDYPD